MPLWISIALAAACGPMSQAPGQPAPAAPAPAPGNPVIAGDPGGSAPSAVPADRYAGAAVAVEASDQAYDAVPASQPVRANRGAGKTGAAAWVDAHNRFRAKHCAAALTWSDKLAEVAQRWANALRDRGCMFGHSGGANGENLAAGTIGTLDPEAVVQMWYDEVAQYRFPDGGFAMKTGHFTQLVWRGTRRVGCGHSQCKGMDILVCEYDPAGNWEGQYRENVLPRGCR